MSNHTIKAKSKKTGKIYLFEIEKDYWLDEEYYSEEAFSDLFEVVEDKPNSIKVWSSEKNDWELIPQTDTLKKEDWEERFDKIDIEFTNAESHDELYLKTVLQKVFKEYKQDVKHFVTQEIAKARDEEREKIEIIINTVFRNSDQVITTKEKLIKLIQNNT